MAKFFETHKNEYASIKYISPEEDSHEHEARAEAMYVKKFEISFLI